MRGTYTTSLMVLGLYGMVLGLASCDLASQLVPNPPGSTTQGSQLDFGFTASNWYAVYTKADSNVSTPSFSDQNHLGFSGSQLVVSGVDLYRGTGGTVSRAVMPVDKAWTLRVKYQVAFGGLYGYTQPYLIRAPDSSTAVNHASTTIVVNSTAGFTTHHSYNGSVLISDSTWLYALFSSNGSGTLTRVMATGNWSDSGGTVIDTVTKTGVTAAFVALTVFYADCYTTSPQPSLTIGSVTYAAN